MLQTCFQNLTERQQRQLVMISGYSGTGKSALASILEESSTKNEGIYAKGKYDFRHSYEPYSGIAMACREICGAMLNSAIENPQDFEDLQRKISRTLGADLPMLIHLMPALEEIVVQDDTMCYSTVGAEAMKGLSSAELKHRNTYAFQRFFRLVSGYFQSIVLVIDDLQWADSISLDLLDRLMSDQELDNMMLIGTFRSNEVDTAHPFRLALQDWRSKAIERNCTVTELEIDNLQLPAVTSVIQDMLKADDPTTLELADLCFKKTRGNIFFLRLLLSTLYERKLLCYNIGTFKWTWDSNVIDETIPSSDNVVDLLKSNMSSLPPKHLEALKLAACLGANFKPSFLERILLKLSGTSERSIEELLPQALEGLVMEGYLKQAGTNFFQFVYDRIQETSSLMVPEEERLDYHYEVGKTLLETLDFQELDLAVFVVADLLNKGTVPDHKPFASNLPVSTAGHVGRHLSCRHSRLRQTTQRGDWSCWVMKNG
jgi:histidine kinase